MSEKESFERDELGDIDIGKIDFDWSDFRRSRYTYAFKYFDEELDHYKPYFDLFSKSAERLENAQKADDYFEKSLYKSSDKPPYDFDIWYHNMQLGLMIRFFKEVFEERAFVEGFQPSHKYFTVIIPYYHYVKIMEFINEFHLLPIRDLIFELIAIGQEKYTEDIAHWEKPYYQKLINTADKEAKKAYRVLEKLDDEDWLAGNGKKPSELLQLKFIFNDETITIQHDWLVREFVTAFKNDYNDLPLKSWKKELNRYAQRFDDNKVKAQFKYKLAKSFYNMLTQAGFYPVTQKNKTPNEVMLCVAKFLEFCLIPIGKAGELDEVKIKLVRNWISRKDFAAHTTFMNLPVDTMLLKKYFEAEFVDLVTDEKKVDALAVVAYLSERFDIKDRLAELAHIASALKEVNWLLGHQLTKNGWIPQFQEFDHFFKLINGVEDNQPITSLKFRLAGEETDRELTSRLPLYLIEQAIKEYAEDQRAELDNDTARVSYGPAENGGGSAKHGNKFNLPEERFIVRFVKSFYDYLLHELPPETDRDYRPSERYYGIIAKMLQLTWFFYHQRHSESFIIEKVKRWHKLGLQGTPASENTP